jgi:hypothetical protein
MVIIALSCLPLRLLAWLCGSENDLLNIIILLSLIFLLFLIQVTWLGFLAYVFIRLLRIGIKALSNLNRAGAIDQ